MPRPDRSDERREALLPVLAQAFAQHGYGRTTTATLAAAAELRENQLYRLWPSKKAMFLAVIDYLYDLETRWWEQMLVGGDAGAAVRRILDEEGQHRGESGLHRITFAGLSEADDPEVREALANMYHRFHKFIVAVLRRQGDGTVSGGDAALHGWALIALGSMVNIARELDLFPVSTQRKLMRDVGGRLAGLSSRAGDRRA